MEKTLNNFTIIRLYPKEDYCCICGILVIGGDKGIPMYEGKPVPFDYKGEWGGFTACDNCFEKYENNQRKE